MAAGMSPGTVNTLVLMFSRTFLTSLCSTCGIEFSENEGTEISQV